MVSSVAVLVLFILGELCQGSPMGNNSTITPDPNGTDTNGPANSNTPGAHDCYGILVACIIVAIIIAYCGCAFCCERVS